MAACAEAGVSVVPQAGNTSLAGGAVPMGDAPQIVLSLSRLNAIRSVDRVGMLIEVEAGCVLQTAQEAALAAGRLLPVSLGAEGTAQVGGIVATNAGGINVLRYGMTRHLFSGWKWCWRTAPSSTACATCARTMPAMTGSAFHRLRRHAGRRHRRRAAPRARAPQPRYGPDGGALAGSRAGAARPRAGRDRRSGLRLRADLGLFLRPARPPLRPARPCGRRAVVCADAGGFEPRWLADKMEEVLAAALEAEEATDGVVASSDAQARQLWNLREHITRGRGAGRERA